MAEYINRYKVLSHSTLMALPKRDLISHIRILEHNWKSALETNEQQYQNTKDWQPVVHGKWVSSSGGNYWKCSNCGEPALYCIDYENGNMIVQVWSHYCPNCGARMIDGESDG